MSKKEKVKKHYDNVAGSRDSYLRKSSYYYCDLVKFFNFNNCNTGSLLEVGCGNGYLLNSIGAKKSVGLDFSSKMIKLAKEKYPDSKFVEMDIEESYLEEKFDHIVVSDTLGLMNDIQAGFKNVKKMCHNDTRLIINIQNFLWNPFLNMAEKIGLKMPSIKLNWLNREDIVNLLELEDLEVIKTGQRFLFPFYIPILSALINRYIANLPLINKLCLTQYIIARLRPGERQERSVSVLIPTMNEQGNVENALKRLPKMGTNTEVIFVEGGSTDDTWGEVQRMAEKYKDEWDIQYAKQDGKGKGDAVRKGFAMAKNDILMILDGDLTVPPEDLPKFYEAIVSGKGEYINGSRLVYPMEDEAMRLLNIAGNKFFSIAFSWLLGQRLKDTLCGTKVLTRKNYLRLAANRHYFGDFDPFGDFDLIFGSAKMNLKIVEVPIRYQAREYGSTNISRFKHGWILLKMTAFAMNKIKFV
jgi:SAM-dependent methyltransferase